MKDEMNLIDCKTFEEVEQAVDEYMDYYNNLSHQWDLNRMSPRTYREILINKNKKDSRSIKEQPSLTTGLNY